jgi:hypothetical protein
MKRNLARLGSPQGPVGPEDRIQSKNRILKAILP